MLPFALPVKTYNNNNNNNNKKNNNNNDNNNISFCSVLYKGYTVFI